MYKFIHIPKTSGTSLYKLMEQSPSCNVKYEGHFTTANDLVKLFAFVRNPYDRVVSMYFYLIHEDRINTPLDAAYRYIVINYSSFKDFVLNMDKDGLLDFMIHLKPQWTWVVDENGNVIPKVFKVEEAEKIDAFLAENGISGWQDFPKENTSEHEPYETYLDREVIAEINRLYAKDFELFNYEKYAT